MKATDMLKKQHREVKALFKKMESVEDGGKRRDIMETIGEKLTAHMMIEEEVFYPAVAESGTKKAAEEMVPEAYEEHHVVKLVLKELPSVDPEGETFTAKMTVLSELIDHHVEEEEKEMFKVAERLSASRLEELGAQMAQLAGEGSDDEDIEEEDRPSRRRRAQ